MIFIQIIKTALNLKEESAKMCPCRAKIHEGRGGGVNNIFCDGKVDIYQV